MARTGPGLQVGAVGNPELREEARQKLGDKFDLRAFHDEVLGSGPLPLDVLHSEVESWIAGQARP